MILDNNNNNNNNNISDEEKYEYMEVNEDEELEEGYEYVDSDELDNEDNYEYVDSDKLDNEDNYEYVDSDELDNEDNYEYVDSDEDGNEIDTSSDNIEKANEETIDELNPPDLSNIQLEYAYLGILFNNPKAISVYYFKYGECYFATEELENLYKIILFQDGEKYAPAIAKQGFSLPTEDNVTYDLKMQLKDLVSKRNFSIEQIYNALKKLYVLKKAFLNSPTKTMQSKILEIVHYDLYSKMTVEEVESAIEQITVTNRLSQAVLNENISNFLISGESNLSNGIEIPFKILSSVFKGLRRGETMSYAMPSNSGKSRFTVNLAAYLAFVQKKKVLIISNEMTEEKMKLCLITTILNNKDIQKLHKQNLCKSEGELLELQFKPDKNIETVVKDANSTKANISAASNSKKMANSTKEKQSKNKSQVIIDKNGYVLREENETNENFCKRLYAISSEFKNTITATNWLENQMNNSIYFIHVTEHSNDDLRKIIMNYYYKENIEYVFYDTMKTEIDKIGNGEEIKKTATVLSTMAQKFKLFIASSLQLLESNTLPVNLSINDMSASKTVKEVLDTLCLFKQINNQTLNKYEYSLSEDFDKCFNLEHSKNPDVRYYACVVDKNRAGAKPTVLFKLNLAYNNWEELGYLRLKQTFIEE